MRDSKISFRPLPASPKERSVNSSPSFGGI